MPTEENSSDHSSVMTTAVYFDSESDVSTNKASDQSTDISSLSFSTQTLTIQDQVSTLYPDYDSYSSSQDHTFNTDITTPRLDFDTSSSRTDGGTFGFASTESSTDIISSVDLTTAITVESTDATTSDSTDVTTTALNTTFGTTSVYEDTGVTSSTLGNTSTTDDTGVTFSTVDATSAVMSSGTTDASIESFVSSTMSFTYSTDQTDTSSFSTSTLTESSSFSTGMVSSQSSSFYTEVSPFASSTVSSSMSAMETTSDASSSFSTDEGTNYMNSEHSSLHTTPELSTEPNLSKSSGTTALPSLIADSSTVSSTQYDFTSESVQTVTSHLDGRDVTTELIPNSSTVSEDMTAEFTIATNPPVSTPASASVDTGGVLGNDTTDHMTSPNDQDTSTPGFGPSVTGRCQYCAYCIYA